MVSESLQSPSVEKQIQVDRLIALWALSEAALGGILHAFRIPLTGLLVNSAAVIFMVFIASSSPRRGAILKATFIVMIIKGIVSPHTPLNAYIAVGFQGVMGELLLRSKKHLLLSSLVLGVITLFQSGIQKILVLTLVYGKVLWESIDIFGNFVIDQLTFIPFIIEEIDFSFWIIAIYIGIHLCAGIAVGIFAAKLPDWVSKEISHGNAHRRIEDVSNYNGTIIKKKKKRWYQKGTTIAIVFLSIGIIISSYLFPEISETQGIKAIIMIVRATCIMFLWYVLLGPLVFKLYKKYIRKKKNAYTAEVRNAIDILPVLRHIIYQTWQNSRSHRGPRRVKIFVVSALVNILSAEFH